MCRLMGRSRATGIAEEIDCSSVRGNRAASTTGAATSSCGGQGLRLAAHPVIVQQIAGDQHQDVGHGYFSNVVMNLNSAVGSTDSLLPTICTASAPTQHKPARGDFCRGDKVSFTDKYLQPQVGTITRINQRTATVDCEGGAGWRVPFAMLHHVMDI